MVFVSDAQVTGAILFFVVVAVLLGGFGLYYVGASPVFERWWEENRARRAARRAQYQERLAQIDRERQIGIETGWLPELVLEGAVEWMTSNGWALLGYAERTATFARDEGADACLGCILMLFFLLPGILYLLLANRT